MKKDMLQKQKEKIESPERLEKIQCKRLLRSKREAERGRVRNESERF